MLLITPIGGAVNNINTIITVIHVMLFFHVIHFILIFHLRMLDSESEENCTFTEELVRRGTPAWCLITRGFYKIKFAPSMLFQKNIEFLDKL